MTIDLKWFKTDLAMMILRVNRDEPGHEMDTRTREQITSWKTFAKDHGIDLRGLPELYDTPLTQPDKPQPVSKILTNSKSPAAPKKRNVTKKRIIMKQLGRPRKKGKVSRTTLWRREKEMQTALI